MIIDTHAHYDDEQFDEDRDQLLVSLSEGGIGKVINVGASLASCRRTLELTKQYPFLYAAIGVHPNEVGTLNEEAFAWLRQACQEEKVVAVGEIGLDYYWNKEAKDLQKEWFIRQLSLARELSLPFCIHSRDAAEDTLRVMKEYASDLPGVIHCYSYSPELAREYLHMGYYIGVGGVVTFNNGKKLKETVRMAPLDRILLETDCPYLSPVPYRGKRNSSLNLVYVVKEIARIKEISYDEVIEQTKKNAKKLFGI